MASRQYLSRLDHLCRVPAVVHFVSCEPQLEGIDFRPWFEADAVRCPYPVNWVITGGESKQGKDHRPRPYHLDWPLRIIRDSRKAGVPVFVKQLGSAPVGEAGWQAEACSAIRHSKGEDPEQWPACLQVREVPPESETPPHNVKKSQRRVDHAVT